MKYILMLQLFVTFAFASLTDIHSFKADFKQIVTDEKAKQLIYHGNISAMTPQYILWNYQLPLKKKIYIKENQVIVIEPEIEQVIIRKIPSDFDFFKILTSAKEIMKDKYETFINEIKYTIKTDRNLISSISYKDEFDNSVKILFENQLQNSIISKDVFTPTIPKDYDIIKE